MRSVWSFIFSLLVMVVLASCENDLQEVAAVTKKDSFPLLTTRDVDMTYTDSARIKIHLTAPVVEDYTGSVPKSVFSEGVYIQFYDDSGKVNSSLKADYAERREREHITLAKKNVVVVNIKGEQLNTEKLTWDEQRRIIYTDAFVKITTADQVIMGNGLESDDTFTEYEIQDITGTIMLNE
jgi:LPS export ABC transporter protein LptC